MFIINCNNKYCTRELEYILKVLLTDFLGLKWTLVQSDNATDFLIIKDSISIRELHIPIIFFEIIENKWLDVETLPTLPLKSWDSSVLSSKIKLIDNILPILYGTNSDAFFRSYNKLVLPIDIFGSAFFMLTRYEEIVNINKVDIHNRFLSGESISSQANFIHRPIIDEYVELLWNSFLYLWPGLKRKKQLTELIVTCDVDSLYNLDFSIKGIAKGLAADILKRYSFELAFDNLKNRIRQRNGIFDFGTHYDNINWIMDVNEKEGNKVIFYFIAGGNHMLDSNYKFGNKDSLKILKSIIERGHEIGLHPSYLSSNNKILLYEEKKHLTEVLNNLNYDSSILNSRQHYLKWDSLITANELNKLGVKVDSTLGYADKPGFRCGTGRTFQMYDLIMRNTLEILQNPLILMETSVVSPEYMGLGYSNKALNYMLEIKKNALKFSNRFTMLWHNSSFDNPNAYLIYKELIKN